MGSLNLVTNLYIYSRAIVFNELLQNLVKTFCLHVTPEICECFRSTLTGYNVCKICGAHGGYETAKVRDVRRNGGGRGLCRGPGKRVDGVFPGRSQSFRHQRRPVDDCSPERGGIAQNGRTRGGTFHGEMDRCRENQGWTTACSGMPERDGMNQKEDSPKQAGSCWFARHCRQATNGASLYTPGVWFAEVMAFFLWC